MSESVKKSVEEIMKGWVTIRGRFAICVECETSVYCHWHKTENYKNYDLCQICVDEYVKEQKLPDLKILFLKIVAHHQLLSDLLPE